MATFAPAYCPAGATTTVHIGKGAIHGITLSSGSATDETVILYDRENSTDPAARTLGKIVLTADQPPVHISYTSNALHFTRGLEVDPGDAEVLIFGHGP